MQIDPSLTYSQIKKLLQSSGSQFPSPEARCHPILSKESVSYDLNKYVPAAVTILDANAFWDKIRANLQSK